MGLGIFMQAYFQLAADRSQSGRIPWSTIQRWCDAKGITGDDAEDAHFLLVRMDMAYLEWAKKKGQKSGDTSGLRKKDA